MTMNLTQRQFQILMTVWQATEPLSPTQIGIEIGLTLEDAPSRVVPTLQKLVEHKVLERTQTNKRSVRYARRKGARLPAVALYSRGRPSIFALPKEPMDTSTIEALEQARQES